MNALDYSTQSVVSDVGTAVSLSHSRQSGSQPRPLLKTDPLLFSRRPYLQNVIFKHLQQGARVQIWLYDNVEQRLEGKILVSETPPPFCLLLDSPASGHS